MRDFNRYLYAKALKGSVASFAIGAAAITASPSHAQDQEQTSSVTAEEIIITGSRIARPELSATSPVTVLNAEEVTLSGTTKIEDLVNSLPQAFATQGSNLANGASGTANISLRNLGRERTLVLINGRRLLPGDPQVPFADVNFIPAALIERVDVLTGGASAVYGSDAVAGVANFVMKTDFEGIRVDGQYSFFQHNNSNDHFQDLNAARNYNYPSGSTTDGGTIDTTISVGTPFADGRGHIMAYATYRKLKGVRQDKRDYSNCAFNASGDDLQCAGSSTTPTGRFFTNDGDFTVEGDQFRDWGGAADQFNYAPDNYYQRPDERFTLGAFAEYEINEHFTPYMEVMFMDDRTDAQIAPSGNFGNTLFINCDNPMFSAQQAAEICKTENLVGYAVDNPETPEDETSAPTQFTDALGNNYFRGNLQILRRNKEGGPRNNDIRHSDYRIVAGMRGDIDDNWNYDVYGLLGTVVFQNTYQNDLSIIRIGRALDVVTDPDSGEAVCRSVIDGTDPNCVPWNIFKNGGVTPGAVNYLGVPGISKGQTREQVVSGSISGSLGDYGLASPWASEGFGVAFGAEYRKESLELEPDISFSTGDLSGQGGATLPVDGSFTVKEFFAEMRVPIVQGMDFAQELSLDLGYRYSDYNTSGGAHAYKIAGEWAPTNDIRFRGGYNRAVRAPNINELFRPQTVLLDGTTDPCSGEASGGLVQGHTLEQCARTGVTAAQFGNIQPNSANQYNGLLGGEPSLEPEKGDTYTIGVVVTPEMLPGFSAAIDWFDIKVSNQITQIGADVILNQCIESGDSAYCSLINRDQFGSLWRTPAGYVTDLDVNQGYLKTRGIDVTLNYSTDVEDYGTLNFTLNGTWVDKLITNQKLNISGGSLDSAYDCAGYFGAICKTPTPTWRHKFRTTWSTPWNLDLSLQWRYFKGVKADATSSDPDLSGDVLPANESIGAQSYFDLSSIYMVNENLSLRLGVNNILDKAPPIVGNQVLPGTFGNGNTFPQVYDALGRFLYFGGTVNF